MLCCKGKLKYISAGLAGLKTNHLEKYLLFSIVKKCIQPWSGTLFFYCAKAMTLVNLAEKSTGSVTVY